ncbi:DUF1127 domain-containing protein [Pelagibius marinus]|uniref:DUF1127 domain-containing protein n=1 Tax=Pelagibius marinus TaxID=2762760 RepID=UPI0029CAA60A|nr:DUF1127 domain-containing protein [Pelagibius marinus]
MPQNQNQTPASWTTRLLDGLRRFGERRALREMLALRSDRLLADIGFNRSDLATDIEAAVASLQIRRQTERRVLRELAGYNDRELRDLGISRFDIRRIAREHAQQAVEARRAEIRDRAKAA